MKLNLDTIKNAVVTTAVVLAVVYAVRQTEFGKSIVTKALAG